jgi:hypothetical protein
MTVLLDKAVDLEKIKAEQAEAASKAAVAEAEKEEAAQKVETAPVEESTPVEDAAPVEEKTQEDVASSSEKNDSASNTTPLKKPEEA